MKRINLERTSSLAVFLFVGSVIGCNSGAVNKIEYKSTNKIKKPNIIFILSDDHAYQTISAYNDRFVQTPNIDRIAQEGALFSNAFVSNSISGPCRACILTGKFSHKNGFTCNWSKFDNAQQTFPKLLQQNGYKTAIVGKWHLNTLPTGFDYWNIMPGQGYYYNPEFINMGKDTIYNGYAMDVTTDLALDWITENKENPFCMLLYFKGVHRNWMPSQDHLYDFRDKKFELPESFFETYESKKALQKTKLTIGDHMDILFDLKVLCDEIPVDPINDFCKTSWEAEYSRLNAEEQAAWNEAYREVIAKFDYSSMTKEEFFRWKYQRFMEDYTRCVLSIDDNVGRVMTYLKENGLEENTILIYASDQGFYLGEHGIYDKRYMYEEGMRFPFVIRYPEQIRTGRKLEQLVMNIDIAPTLLDFSGTEIPSDIQGKSLKPILIGKNNKSVRKDVYYHYYETAYGVMAHYGLRTKRYKLIHYYDPSDSWELYDLKNDPHELDNLVDNPKYARIFEKMKENLKKRQIEIDDTDENIY